MSYRTKIIDLELDHSLQLPDLNDYAALQALVKFRGRPIAHLQLPVSNGKLTTSIASAVFPTYTPAICRQLVRARIADPNLHTWEIAALLDDLPPQPSRTLPTVTVACCLRCSPDSETAFDAELNNLTICLDALQQLNGATEVLVIEANPQSKALEQHIHQHYPSFKYLASPAAGLNNARNLAIQQAQAEIIAFTDERGIVDAAWVKTLSTCFAEHPEVMAVTGLVVPYELETEAQIWYEAGYGLGRGCERKWYHLDLARPVAWPMLGTMQIGSGVNMAYRRQVFERVGCFNSTLAQAESDGGDWEMFSRLLLAGQTLLYESAAIVRYRSARSVDQLQADLTQEASAFFSYVWVGISRYPDQGFNFLCLGGWKLARLLLSYLRPDAMQRNLVAAELRGSWRVPLQFTSREASQISTTRLPEPKQQAVRLVDLTQPLPDFADLEDYRSLRVFVTVGQTPVGRVDIEHGSQFISAARLQEAIADQLWLALLALPYGGDEGVAWAQIQSVLTQRWMPSPVINLEPRPVLAADVPVTIIITTCDRPQDLSNCLHHLRAQRTSRPVEIIVADNRPASGLTPPVVAQFPGVKLVSESRPGGSYGRNAAIIASSGEIIVSVDDDVTVPADWLEKLIAPLGRPEVMVVTGNVLPLELDTPAQILFETVKGGLGEGFQPFEVDGQWWASFQVSPPTWDLGVSANAAFRATLFSHPQIGLMDEVLGPGTPTGGGEENHLIYKALRAGYTLVYEPAAYVWHKHRRDLPGLYKQVYGHMKGGTAYHLLLWLQEKDQRGFRQLFFELPRYYIRHIRARLRGQHQTPWRFLWSEIAGYFAGYWGYWQSCRRVKQQGRSVPYVPVAQRFNVAEPVLSQVNPPQILTGVQGSRFGGGRGDQQD
jgi:GT2 family glycosyltransferase